MRLMIVTAAALLATAAQAQLLGTPLPPVGATGQVGVAVPDPVPPVVATTRDAARATERTTRDANIRDRSAVRVDAGASVRVERGTRCYYDDYYYDPNYRDGYYYCERRGTELNASTRVKTR